MNKMIQLIQEVYRYEKRTEIETQYISNILLWFSFIVLLINYFNNSYKTNTGIYIFCIIIAFLGVFFGIRIRKSKNVDRFVKTSTIVLLLSSIYCLYFGGNDGFQNLWFFIAPCILLVLVGIPFGVPCCMIYGCVITIIFWSPLRHYMNYDYSYDYCIFYPVFYWCFSIIIFITNLFYKKYRIEQEKAEMKMEAEVQRVIKDAQKLMLNSVTAIGKMIDEKDTYTKEHSQRVADYSLMIAQNIKDLKMSELELEQLYRSALLHDIGKIAIPDAILKKPSRLTDEEFKTMKTHPVWGKKILASLSFLPQADYGACYHHERYDGKGYPEGKRLDELPYMVRIISAADALDAMNFNRCYRKHCNKEYIINEFKKGSGSQFDPVVASTVVHLIQEGKIIVEEDDGYD